MNLIIDGHYLFYRTVFGLVKYEKHLVGLSDLLRAELSQVEKLHSFDRVFYCSDSSHSWRKDIFPDYKGTRTKTDKINWEVAFHAQEEFFSALPENIILLRSDGMEGDDWITALCTRANALDQSNFIISSDHDLHQLLMVTPAYINMQYSGRGRDLRVFVPEGYDRILSHLPKPSLFNDESIFRRHPRYVLNNLKEVVIEPIDPLRSLFTKIITGDKGDNVGSLHYTPHKKDPTKSRGIGLKRADAIYEAYLNKQGFTMFDTKEEIQRVENFLAETLEINDPDFSQRFRHNLRLMRLDGRLLPTPLKKMVNQTLDPHFT